MVTKVSFVPLGERIVILPMEQESTTKGGIYLPDTAKEKPQEGEVVAVGPGRVTDDGTRVDMELSVGRMFAVESVQAAWSASVELKEPPSVSGELVSSGIGSPLSETGESSAVSLVGLSIASPIGVSVESSIAELSVEVAESGIVC